MRIGGKTVMVAMALLVGACASGAGADDVAITGAPELAPVESDAVLTVVGGDGGEFTFAAIEELPMTELDILEPFVQERTVFQGPLIHDVFELAGIESGAVEVLAINDYGFSAEVDDWPADAVLATRENGELIPIDDGGPFRVVAPDGTELSEELDAWVWSIDRLVIGG